MLQLTADERGMVVGERGEAARLAMEIVAETARLLGAPRLIPVASAHIDGALYHGDSGTMFAEHLLAAGAKVAVPTTLNIGALDLLKPGNVRTDGATRTMALRLMQAYERMGCRATWTCSPYQAGHRPGLGQHVAWGESNAVAFCNSVLGARTNRNGDFLDIACAIVGRAPYCGLHLDENRKATVEVDCGSLPARLRASSVLYPVLGAWYGRVVGDRVGLIRGLGGPVAEDHLKAFGAAAASSGAVGLFHIAGITPEAIEPEAVLATGRPIDRVVVTAADLASTLAAFSSASGDRVDAVAVGSPHFSVDEFAELQRLLAGRRVSLPFYACTGRHAIAALKAAGRLAELEAAGITIIADTCVVATPVLGEAAGVLMTNSAKFAHYAPGNTGYAVQFGSLSDCVESAVAGRLVRRPEDWQ